MSNDAMRVALTKCLAALTTLEREGETRFPETVHASANAAQPPREPVQPLSDTVSVCKTDANNYCRILTALGMEEEGDPVAEIERLITERMSAGGTK